MRKIRSSDEVVVITGKDKGRRGKIMQVLEEGKILVQGVNRVKKHVKPNPNAGVQGGIIEKEMPVDISNVMLVCNACAKPSKVGYRQTEDGKKVRFCKKCNEIIE